MKFSIKPVAAAVMLALGSTAALAQVVTPLTPPSPLPPTTAPTTGASGTLIVAVWDTFTGQSIFENLGISQSGSGGSGAANIQIPSLTSTTANGLSIDFGTIGLSGGTNYFTQTFASALNGTGGDSVANLQFAVFSANPVGTGLSHPTNQLFTTLVDPAPLHAAINGNNIWAAGNSVTNFLLQGVQSHVVTNGLWIADNVAFAGSQGSGNAFSYASQGSQFGGVFPGTSSNSAGLGQSMAFYLVSAASNAGIGTTTEQGYTNGSDSRIGTFTLSGVGSPNGVGDLTYLFPATAGAVPLPAALWLLLSGLMGVGAIGRRKPSVAA